MSEQQIMKKSIFKQETHSRIYEPELSYQRNIYSLENIYHLSPSFTDVKVSEDIIATIEISMPLLKVGNKFYLEDEDKTVIIKSVIRTSKDNVLYFVEPIIIDDKDSLSKIKDLLNSDQYKILYSSEKYNNLYKLKETLSDKIKDYNKLPLFKKIFTNTIK